VDLAPEIRVDIRAYLTEVRANLDLFDGLLDSDQLAVDDSDLLSDAEDRLRDLRYGYIDRLGAGLPIIDPRNS